MCVENDPEYVNGGQAIRTEQTKQNEQEAGQEEQPAGQYIRKNRSVRQPSRKVRRWGACDLRPSGWSVIGTSAMR